MKNNDDKDVSPVCIIAAYFHLFLFGVSKIQPTKSEIWRARQQSMIEKSSELGFIEGHYISLQFQSYLNFNKNLFEGAIVNNYKYTEYTTVAEIV